MSPIQHPQINLLHGVARPTLWRRLRPGRHPAKWLRSGLVALVLLAAALWMVYADILVELVQDWENDPNNSHGFLVPLVSAYLIWERQHQLAQIPLRPSNWGVIILGMGLVALLLGGIGAELFIQRMSLVIVLIGLVILLLGWRFFKALAFPVGFLALSVPLPAIVLNQIALPLQLFAAQVAERTLFFLSIPVYREGNIIHLAATTLEVAEACSGIRSLVSLIVMAMVFGYFVHRGLLSRTLLVLSAIPIAVVANAGRVAGTGILAHFYGVQAAQGFYHTFSGWLVFVVALAMLVVESMALRWAERWLRARKSHAA